MPLLRLFSGRPAEIGFPQLIQSYCGYSREFQHEAECRCKAHRAETGHQTRAFRLAFRPWSILLPQGKCPQLIFSKSIGPALSAEPFAAIKTLYLLQLYRTFRRLK